MRSYFLYFILFLGYSSQAQNRLKLDSLLHVKLGKEDTILVRHYIQLCYEYKKIAPDSSVYWVNKSIALAKKIRSEKYEILTYHSKGFHYRSINENQLAADTLLYALGLSEKSEKKTGLANISMDLGVVYRLLGNFDKSITCFQKALKHGESIKNKKTIYNSYNSLANTYAQMGMSKRSVMDLERALQYYEKAFFYADSTKKAVLSMIKGNNGVALFNLGIIKKDSMLLLRAKDMYMESLAYKFPLNDSIGMAQCYGNIAGAYHELCNISVNERYLNIAKKYYELSLAISKKIGSNTMYHDELNYGTHLALMGRLKKDKVLTRSAIDHLKKALESCEKYNDVVNLVHVHGSLSACYQDLGQFETSNYHLNRFVSLKDTLLSQENKQIAEELTAKYESELKETENNSLKNEAVLREEVISKKSTTINVMIIESILLLGLIILVLISRQKITKAKLLTEKQKLIIEEKNKEITDSINYAKRLQNTMLAGETTLTEIWEESFILYKPKDIVSGDFYWYSSNGKDKIFAAVDCTGHGVPGAFMSMLGITFLNEIVLEKKITRPHLILGELRDRVKSTLKQKGAEGESRDGMDIAVININSESSTLEFSGANNPLWMCRDGELIEVNSDKRPIGYFKGAGLPFTNHSIDIKKGDLIYIFTDGYADQFGGPRGKKFKYKTLNELLVSIHKEPMSKQKEILEQRFNEWKGNLEQVDDVLILGIKI